MKNIFLFIFSCLLQLVLVNCTTKSQTGQDTRSIISTTEDLSIDNQELSKNHDYQLANELVDELLKSKVDTILFYKRTCINCCDFYNVFWEKKGNLFLHKFYFDFDDMKTHSIRIKLEDDEIFKKLKTDYSSLLKTSIKENEHKMKNGSTSTIITSHYCYTSIKIYTQNDSIISNQIKDIDLNKNSDVKDGNGVLLTNDNYEENINSKWHSLLVIIEKEISSMSETSKKEKEIMRVLE